MSLFCFNVSAGSVYFSSKPFLADKLVYFTSTALTADKIISYTKNPILAHDCLIYKESNRALATHIWHVVKDPLVANLKVYVSKSPFGLSHGCL